MGELTEDGGVVAAYLGVAQGLDGLDEDLVCGSCGQQVHNLVEEDIEGEAFARSRPVALGRFGLLGISSSTSTGVPDNCMRRAWVNEWIAALVAL